MNHQQHEPFGNSQDFPGLVCLDILKAKIDHKSEAFVHRMFTKHVFCPS